MILGKHHSEETKKKISKARQERKRKLGYINSPETRRRISKAQKGKKLSEKTKRKLSRALKGRKKPPFTEEHRRKLSETLKGKPQPWNAGERCHFWRGGMMKEVSVKCAICGKINLIRRGRLEKLNHPYRCLSCSMKGRVVSYETKRKLSLVNRKYNLDESFFEKINNEEKAYWLGFFAGDGNITDENRLRVRLNIRDRNHLMKFKKAIKWNGRDYYPKHQGALEVHFKSFKIVNDLARYYITPRKTFIIKFPKISRELKRHFVRGVFDADGCINKAERITYGKSGQKYIFYGGEFCIEGNKEFISAIQSRLVEELGLPITSINYSGKNINRVRYGGINQLKTIYKYLYENATIFLERKKKLFEEILKNYHCEIIQSQEKEFKISKFELTS